MSFYSKKKPKNRTRSKATRKRRRTVVEIDAIIRQQVHERDQDKCVRCGSVKCLTVSHVYPKGTFGNLRWSLDNLKLLCFPCHRWWHLNPVDATDWWKKNWPERYERLSLARHTAPKPNVKELLADLHEAIL